MDGNFFPQPRYRRRQQTINEGKSLTEQAHKDDCSIQKILKKYQATGVLAHTNAHEGTYQNYIDTPGYQEAQLAIASAKSLFESLPSRIRADMGNSPQQFVEFMQNTLNRDKIQAYGLSTAHLPPIEEKTPTPDATIATTFNPPDGTTDAPADK